jgi:hypothetical protein
MDTGTLAVLLTLGIPWVVIPGIVAIKVIEARTKQRQVREKEQLSGEQALFGLSAAEDLRDLKQRMGAVESQISEIASAVRSMAAAPVRTARSLDAFAEEPAEPPVVEQQV